MKVDEVKLPGIINKISLNPIEGIIGYKKIQKVYQNTFIIKSINLDALTSNSFGVYNLAYKIELESKDYCSDIKVSMELIL